LPKYSFGQVLLTERTEIQIDKQTATLIPYIMKKIYSIQPKTRLLIYSEKMYIHTLHTNRHTRQSRPPSPPKDDSLTHRAYRQTDKNASAVTKSAFLERGKLKSEGGKLSTNQKPAFSFVLLLS
jgi:hypothetical protein